MNLIHNIVDAFREYRAGFASILWDLGDRSLIDVDRELRRELLHDKRAEIGARLQSKVDQNPNYYALLLCYGAARQTDPSLAIDLTQKALDHASARHLKALASSMLATYLAQRSRDHLQLGNEDAAMRDATLCRSMCEVAFSENESESWYSAISWSLHTALGSLDRWSQDIVGATIHFTKAIEEYQKLDSRLKSNERDTLGILHIEFGDVHRLNKNLDAATREYETATGIVIGASKVTALSRLVAVLIEKGVELERGRQLAQSAMKLARELNLKAGLIDELESNLAYLHWQLGDRPTAIQLYERLDRDGVHPKIRQGVKKLLAELKTMNKADK